MITRFRLENFKAHRDTDLAFQQFTVLVGDNNSGKTSVLEALRLPAELTAEIRDEAKHTGSGFKLTDVRLDELIRRGEDHVRLSAQGKMAGGRPWTMSIGAFRATEEDWSLTWEGSVADRPAPGADGIGYWEGLHHSVSTLIGRAALYRFRADQIADAAYSERTDAAVAEDGAQTAVALAALKLADDEAFNRIESAMRRLVPSLRRIFIRPATLQHPSNPNPVTGSKLYFDFQGAKAVPAHHASQGTLIALALLTVLHGRDRTKLILLDDFDHSLHPRAQMELVRMIKELLALDEFQDTQIIATTHSPYVLDEISPSDVIAFALRDDGTVAAKPLSEHPDAPRVNGSLKAGELWTLDAERDWVR